MNRASVPGLSRKQNDPRKRVGMQVLRLPPTYGKIMSTLKEMVSSGKVVRFVFYRAKELWYTTECGFEFPVPIDDVGDATFLASDKAIMLMRYIRKHMAMLAEAKATA